MTDTAPQDPPLPELPVVGVYVGGTVCSRDDALRLVAELRAERDKARAERDSAIKWLQRAETAERRLAELERAQGWMPLMGTGLAIRMGLLNEQQAQKNHYQSLERLAQRGGLSPSEAAAIIDRREWRSIAVPEAIRTLLAAAPPAPG